MRIAPNYAHIKVPALNMAAGKAKIQGQTVRQKMK
jgi:hypothetical protein